MWVKSTSHPIVGIESLEHFFCDGSPKLAHHTKKIKLNLWSNALFGGENLAIDHTKKGQTTKASKEAFEKKSSKFTIFWDKYFWVCVI